MPVRAPVDAGPLIGWLNASDQWHGWSCSVLSQVRGPLHTGEIVLGEACGNPGGTTRPAPALLTLVRLSAIRLLQPWPDHLERTQALMLKHEAMDAADASLVVLSEVHPDARVITTDRADFTVYRRFRAQKIPVVRPG